MSGILKKGQVVHTEQSKQNCTVIELLGAGGQGEVYRAEIGGNQVALKWYFENTASTQQRDSLKKIIESGAPNNKFLWPIELTSEKGVPGFGYIMPLRDARFKSIAAYLKRKFESNFKSVITASFQLADSFFQLHTKGLCYQDVSIGNVFFDPKNGDVLICDNDNVTVNNSEIFGVLGTPGFMAPEIVRKEAKPSSNTDLHSLAVLIFHLLLIGHPLDGKKEADIKCKDLPAMEKLYGTEPIFIFDPNNKANYPVKGYQDNPVIFWAIYPQYLKDLFVKAFTVGISDYEHGRVRENEWRNALSQLRDFIVLCPKCGENNFYDMDKIKSQGKLSNCWNCKSELILPFRIKFDKNIVMLNYDTKLFAHHLKNDYNFSDVIGQVAQHPTDKSIFGLKNMTQNKWTVTDSSGNIKEIEPGKSISLSNGVKINFGNIEGEVRY